MSRAVQEDLSGLPLQERLKKHASNFGKWAYDGENGTYFGSRKPLQWGQLCLYYLVFYAFLAGFTAIFFGVLGFMLPIRPITGDNDPIESCSTAPNAFNLCGRGPFFQALDLAEVSGDTKKTDGIYKFGVCEPAVTAIPRSLNLLGSEPESGYTLDSSRVGYQSFINTVNRIQCLPPYDNAATNPECSLEESPNTKILPLVPKAPIDRDGNTSFMDEDDLLDIISSLDDGPYSKPAPIYSFVEGENTYETFIVFFKFNKVWNYQPYAVEETDGLKTNGLEAPIENNIGLACRVSNPCVAGVKARNAFNEEVTCDSGRYTTSNGRVHIDELTQVMVNVDGFPWRGGPLNMGLGSIAVTYLKSGPAADAAPWSDFDIVCTMGVEIVDGRTGLNADSSSQTTKATSKAIMNLDKPGPAGLYTKSDGRSVEIPVTL